MAPRVVHLGIQVSDLNRSSDFYRRLLNMKKIPVVEGSEGPMGFVKLGDFELVLHQIPGAAVAPRNRLDHFGIEVDDLAAALERARELGAATSEIHPSFRWWQFNAIDPDGYPFHVMSRHRPQ